MSKNNEIIETPEVIDEDIIDTTVAEVCEEPEEESGIGLGKIVLGTALVAGGIGFLCHKFRHKIEEHQVNKLRKKGYTIEVPMIDDIYEDFDSDDFEDEIVDADVTESEKK